ncbi:MAG: hypothetical protein ACRC28_17425 [Clostridium sp.]|uniref:hypothetical protein n=1 Tax=Clostridium sp. TaxID=1506 RepID=UPI003F388A8F
MNSLEVFGTNPFDESLLTPLNKTVTKDINLFVDEEILDINKIYVHAKGEFVKGIFETPLGNVCFIDGLLKVRLEYLTVENRVSMKDFSLAFSEEVDLKNLITKDTCNNVDIDVNVEVNNLFYKLLNKNSIFLSAFLTLSLEIV